MIIAATNTTRGRTTRKPTPKRTWMDERKRVKTILVEQEETGLLSADQVDKLLALIDSPRKK